jgi:hypothetical protein
MDSEPDRMRWFALAVIVAAQFMVACLRSDEANSRD